MLYLSSIIFIIHEFILPQIIDSTSHRSKNALYKYFFRFLKIYRIFETSWSGLIACKLRFTHSILKTLRIPTHYAIRKNKKIFVAKKNGVFCVFRSLSPHHFFFFSIWPLIIFGIILFFRDLINVIVFNV